MSATLSQQRMTGAEVPSRTISLSLGSHNPTMPYPPFKFFFPQKETERRTEKEPTAKNADINIRARTLLQTLVVGPALTQPIQAPPPFKFSVGAPLWSQSPEPRAQSPEAKKTYNNTCNWSAAAKGAYPD